MLLNIRAWCREHQKDILLAIFILLVATTSFALGYLVSGSEQKADIVIEKK